MKRITAIILSFFILTLNLLASNVIYAEEMPQEGQEDSGQSGTPAVEISAPSAVLMEASTGKVIYEKDKDTARHPASVTKIMTMLLIFDALADGRLQPEDEVTVSEYAASMGGSQVYLEAGEIQTVDTMLKCIAVASANDACVAMAEEICGSEEEFVARMNERATGLGMEHTHFVNCNGLDAEGHLTSAHDIALMSRELITKYPQVHDYSMIWMEDITHRTAKGESEFGLSNTNKLVRQYEYTTGLKTGSTGDAKFCVSATAEKNGVELIAVIMGAESSKERFADAVKLLNYGFGKCQLYTDDRTDGITSVPVENGVQESVKAGRKSPFTYLDTEGANLNGTERKINLEEKIAAPVKKGDKVGSIKYSLDGKVIGESDIIALEDVKKATFSDRLGKAAQAILL